MIHLASTAGICGKYVPIAGDKASLFLGEVTCDRCRMLVEAQPGPASRASADPFVAGAVLPGSPEPKASSMVDSPAHYTGGSIECIDAIDALVENIKDPRAGFYAAQVVKYLWRHEKKNGLEDLKKARWYLNRLIGTKEKP